MSKPELSIVILNYNTSDLLRSSLKSLYACRDEVAFEVIVVENGSSDNSLKVLEKEFKWVKVIKTGENLGFARGNNRAKGVVLSDFVLFLNTDVIVYKNVLKQCLNYLKDNNLGALTCKLVLANGKLDKDARRSFITPWIGLFHLFLKLDLIFPKSKYFAKYWYGYIPEDKVHEVDAIQGAFFLTRKKILDEVGWFDEDYFLDAEDIDLSWKIKQRGYKIVYYPKVWVTHLKGATKGKNKSVKKYIPLKEKLKFRLSGVNSMEIFYRKRLWNMYPLFLNYIVILGINVIKAIRTVEVLLSK